jgi:hypothetical protein
MSDSTPGSQQSCALCGGPRAEGARAPAAERRARIGRPFEACWRCGRRVERQGTNEWVLFPRPVRWSIAARHLGAALAFGGVPPLLHASLCLLEGRRWEARDALLFLALGWLLAGLIEAARLLLAIDASRRRMSDPMYRATLMQQGIAASRAEGRA